MEGRWLLYLLTVLLIYISDVSPDQNKDIQVGKIASIDSRSAEDASQKNTNYGLRLRNQKDKRKQQRNNDRIQNKSSKKKSMKNKWMKLKIIKEKRKAKRNKKRKMKQYSRKKKNKKENTHHSSIRQTQTCSGNIAKVDSSCLENAMLVLLFDGNQVANYLKQLKILISHKRQTGNKLVKKGEFEEAAEHILWAVGGDIRKPKCGYNSSDLLTRTKNQRDLATSLASYEKLKNCSAAIKEACTTSNQTYNAAIEKELQTCNKSMGDFRATVEKCINLKDAKNSTAQCGCWSIANTEMDAIKILKCSTKKKQKEITQEKKVCISVFGKCKKMEDSSVELVYKCMNTHSMYLINQTADSLHFSALKDASKNLDAEAAKALNSGKRD